MAAAMPTPNSPDRTNPPPSIPPGKCPKCGQPMKLTSIETHPRFTNMDARNYTCEHCGETETFLVMR
jgi:hypothetical protein